MVSTKTQFSFLILLSFYLVSCNPFAPGLEDLEVDPATLLGDRSTIDGFFEWFRNSYELRDSTLYGQIIAPDFTFSYRDFSSGNTIIWGRDEEMNNTYSLFQSVEATSLTWNHYLVADTSESDTLIRLERAFNLIIVQDANTIFRGTGSADLILRRDSPNSNWTMLNWQDKSDF